MLLKVHHKENSSLVNVRLENMTIGHFDEMALFCQSIQSSVCEASVRKFTVTHKSPSTKEERSIEIPLVPDFSSPEVLDISLYGSPTKAYKMDEIFNSWFSACFGYEVLLVYLGPYERQVLGNVPPKMAYQNLQTGSWYTSIYRKVLSLWSTTDDEDNDKITFADVAPYLIVTEESLHDVSSHLANSNMNITKFRPNIVLAGSTGAYDEDFWSELRVKAKEQDGSEISDPVDIILTQNCARCKSINVDYSTGKQGLDESGTILKKLMNDVSTKVQSIALFSDDMGS